VGVPSDINQNGKAKSSGKYSYTFTDITDTYVFMERRIGRKSETEWTDKSGSKSND